MMRIEDGRKFDLMIIDEVKYMVKAPGKKPRMTSTPQPGERIVGRIFNGKPVRSTSK